MDGKHLVVTCTLCTEDQVIQTHALIDCEATGYTFIDEEFTMRHHLPLTPLRKERQLEVIDGRPIASGNITRLCRATMTIQEHREQLPMFVTKLGHYPVVLGIPWLRQYDPAIRFASNLVTFGSQYCLDRCHDRPVTVSGVIREPPPANPTDTEEPVRVYAIGAQLFTRTARKKRLPVLSLNLYETNSALGNKKKARKQLEELIPPEYHGHLKLFSEAAANKHTPPPTLLPPDSIERGVHPAVRPCLFPQPQRTGGPKAVVGREPIQGLHTSIILPYRGANPFCQEVG